MLRGTAYACVIFLLFAVVPDAAANHAGVPSRNGVQPIYVSGNPTCKDIGAGMTELKVEPVGPGTYSNGDIRFTISSVSDGRFFDWTANQPISVIIVKGGTAANVYRYDPAATRDGSLHAPINHSSNKPYGLSNVSICDDPHNPPPPPPPPPDKCTGVAFDTRVDIAGTPIAESAGPVISTDKDVFPDREEAQNVTLGVPSITGALVTADVVVAENTGDPETGCLTHVTFEKLRIDLDALPGSVPLVITANTLEVTAVAFPDTIPTTTVRITDLAVNGIIVGDIFDVDGSVRPNVLAVDLSSLGLLGISGGIFVHERAPIPDGILANGIHIQLNVVNVLLGVNYSVDVKVGHAERSTVSPSP